MAEGTLCLFRGTNREPILVNIYNVSLVVDRKTCGRSDMLFKSALLKSIFGHDSLFVALHRVLELVCILESFLEEIYLGVF